MKTITVDTDASCRRLDRFLKKYLSAAPLSLIYRLVRKDVKVNGERKGVDYLLREGDEVALYVSEARIDELSRRGAGGGGFRRRPKIQFGICYEDDNVLAVSKPYGLLTHGDSREKKDTLVNQVVGYLASKGDYDPAEGRLFTPSPVNRLDRNTTGLVVFGKNGRAVRDFSRMVADSDAVEKYYTTLVLGEVVDELTLTGAILKDKAENRVSVADAGGAEGAPPGKSAQTVVRPIEIIRGGGRTYTLAEVRLVTGRPHQIRAHLAAAGHPVAGDPKYGDRASNRILSARCGLHGQFLHAHRLEIRKGSGALEYLTGVVMESPLPRRLADATRALTVPQI